MDWGEGGAVAWLEEIQQKYLKSPHMRYSRARTCICYNYNFMHRTASLGKNTAWQQAPYRDKDYYIGSKEFEFY